MLNNKHVLQESLKENSYAVQSEPSTHLKVYNLEFVIYNR